jgi:hypothetical protein
MPGAWFQKAMPAISLVGIMVLAVDLDEVVGFVRTFCGSCEVGGLAFAMVLTGQAQAAAEEWKREEGVVHQELLSRLLRKAIL